MKNFTKKLALLLVFAMVLGVVAPGRVAKAAAEETRKVVINFSTLTFELKADKGTGSAVRDFEFTQFVGDNAPTAEDIKKIKDKDWVEVNNETSETVGDLSWFNKKKASYVLVRIYENNAYTYITSDKIAAAEDAFKVLYSQDAEAEANGTKTPKYTSAQSIGTKDIGYFVFYSGKGTSMKVLTPNAIGFRVDGTFIDYKSVKLKNDTSTSSDFIKTVKRMIAKGGTLLFVQNKYGYNENDYHTDRTGWPVAKEVKFKIAAQKAAPTVKLDIAHVAPLKAGQEYRIINAKNNKKSAWVSVDTAHGEKDSKGKVKVGKVLLENLVVTTAGIDASLAIETGENGFATTEGTLNPAALATGNVKLQVRTAASSKGVASKIYSVVVSQKAIGTAASTASVAGKKDADLTVSYKKAYDAKSPLVITNNTEDDYEVCFLTSGASLTATDKWTAVKGKKTVEVKSLENREKEAYTDFLVRKVGDKKNGILSSNFHSYAIKDVTVVKQSITENANGKIDGVSGSAVKVTSDGAVKVTIPKSEVSGAAIKEKSIEVAVVGVTDPGTLKWKTKGTGKSFTLDVPTYSKDTKKVTFKIKEIKAGATGNSGDYICEVEGLTFKVNVAIGD